MLKSMTAFGRHRTVVNGKDITAEIKAVNNRYLDCNIKITRAYSFLEEKVRSYITSCGISRGKLDIYIGVDILEQQGVSIALDPAYAASYIKALENLRDEFGLKDDISVMSVAQNREIFTITKEEDDIERDWEDIRAVLEKAVEAFCAAREREGQRLEDDIAAKLDFIHEKTDKIAELSAKDIAEYGPKLEARIRQILEEYGKGDTEISDQRILTEVAMFADKAAIDEELVRLHSHFESFNEIVASPEPAGRKLDFLLQEINRETNTIGSKAGNSTIAHLVVDVKSELEKIREQVQNIE